MNYYFLASCDWSACNWARFVEERNVSSQITFFNFSEIGQPFNMKDTDTHDDNSNVPQVILEGARYARAQESAIAEKNKTRKWYLEECDCDGLYSMIVNFNSTDEFFTHIAKCWSDTESETSKNTNTALQVQSHPTRKSNRTTSKSREN